MTEANPSSHFGHFANKKIEKTASYNKDVRMKGDKETMLVFDRSFFSHRSRSRVEFFFQDAVFFFRDKNQQSYNSV
jgi:hypothetical protein